MRVFGLGAMLDVDVVVDHARLEGAGPEQCDQRDDVVEAVRLQLLISSFMPRDSSWNTAVVCAVFKIS